MELFKPRSMKAEFELDLVESGFFWESVPKYDYFSKLHLFILTHCPLGVFSLSQQDNPMCPAWAHPDPCCAVGRRTPGLSFYGCIFFCSTPSFCCEKEMYTQFVFLFYFLLHFSFSPLCCVATLRLHLQIPSHPVARGRESNFLPFNHSS